MKLEILTISILYISSVSALNVLAIFPYEGKSHFLVFKVFLQALAERGHNLTIISHYPQEDVPDNYHDISLAGTIEPPNYDFVPLETNYLSDCISVFATSFWLASTGVEDCDMMLANKQVQDLVTNKQKFDVVLVEQFNSDCGLGIAYKLGAPVVGATSHILMPSHYERFGIPLNPSFVSVHFRPSSATISLSHKVELVISNFIFNKMYYWISQRNNHRTLEKYFGDVPPLEELARDIKILLLCDNFALTGSKLLPANVIEVGGYHVDKARPLTGDLQKFIEEATHGVIYISFGSILKSSHIPQNKVQEILDATNQLPQRFIWKWDDKTLPVDNNKVYIDSWLPQVDILGHPKTLAFFSHAGMGGTIEAVHFGVPIVAMPVFGDQPTNAIAIEKSGFGVQLQYRDLNTENLVAAFKKLLDPGFQKQAKEVSAAWHDRPMRPLDTAIFWTEFVARHPNIIYRTAAADVPFYKYLCLDVIAVLLTTTFIVFFVHFKVFTLVCCRKSKKTVKAQKGKNEQKKRMKRE